MELLFGILTVQVYQECYLFAHSEVQIRVYVVTSGISVRPVRGVFNPEDSVIKHALQDTMEHPCWNIKVRRVPGLFKNVLHDKVQVLFIAQTENILKH